MTHLRDLIVDGRIKKALFLLNKQDLSSIELTQKDPENNTPLHWAVKLGYSELIEPLLNTDARISRSIKNRQGLTPYDLAKQLQFPAHFLMKLRSKAMVAANAEQQLEAYTQAT